MTPTSIPGRAAVVLAGALLGGAIAAGASVLLPEPFPFAVALAVAVPVMDVGLYPGNVPDDAPTAARVGVLAALGGLLVGGVAAAAVVALGAHGALAYGLAGGSAYLGAEFAGGRVLGRATNA